MGKKKEEAPAGQPAWLTTYCDTMTLLVCFFILMFAYRKVGEPAKAKDMMTAIRKGFHEFRAQDPHPGPGPMTSEDAIPVLMERQKNMGAEFLSVEGIFVRATFVDEGVKFTFAGKPIFQPGSAALSPEGEAAVLALGKQYLAGFKNKIEIRGFTSDEAEDTLRESHWRLGYARAAAVATLTLDAERVGVAPERVRVLSGGRFDPVSAASTEIMGRELNRRVEVMVYEMFAPE